MVMATTYRQHPTIGRTDDMAHLLGYTVFLRYYLLSLLSSTILKWRQYVR